MPEWLELKKWLRRKNQKQDEELSEKRPSRLLLLALLIAGLPFLLFADTHFEFNKESIDIHKDIYALKLDASSAKLHVLAESQPDNLVVDLLTHLNYTLKAFISETEADYEALMQCNKTAYHRIASSHSSSPFRNFGLAELNFQSALLLAKRGRYMKAGQQLNQAYKQLKRNTKKFPDFPLNNKTEGLINCYLSTVPDNYKWAIELLGVQGDLDRGLAQLKSLAYSNAPRSEIGYYDKEAAFYYAFTLTHIAHDNGTAWQVVQDRIKDHRESPLSAFFAANTGFKVRKNQAVIRILEGAPKGEDHYPLHILDYMLGSAKLFALDSSAIDHLQKFHKVFKGKNFKKANLQKMSWYYKLYGKESLHLKYKNLILSTGHTNIEEDKAADNYANKPSPNSVLLKARLLFDGGHYSRAQSLISPYKAKHFKTMNEKAEYCYRKGRIYQELEQMEIAIMYYDACSKYGAKSIEYYGAYACLYLGDHYLENNNKKKALHYYRKAELYPNNKEYLSSIEVKVKKGVEAANAL